jgi:hypothetical protein
MHSRYIKDLHAKNKTPRGDAKDVFLTIILRFEKAVFKAIIDSDFGL